MVGGKIYIYKILLALGSKYEPGLGISTPNNPFLNIYFKKILQIASPISKAVLSFNYEHSTELQLIGQAGKSPGRSSQMNLFLELGWI